MNFNEGMVATTGARQFPSPDSSKFLSQSAVGSKSFKIPEVPKFPRRNESQASKDGKVERCRTNIVS